MRTCCLLAVATIAIATQAASATGEWQQLSALPRPLMGLHAEVIGNRIYTIGGQVLGAGRGQPTNRVAVFDTAGGTWSEASPMPTERGFLGTAVVDGQIYVIGGSPNMREYDPATNLVEVYDATANEWHSAPPLPMGRADLTVSVVDGRIYAFGGTEHVAVDALGVVEMFDPATGVWTRRADMPTPRLHLTSVSLNGEIYVFGGGPEWPVPLATLEIYKPATNSWRKGADMPTARTGLWAAAIEGKIYVAGGLSWDNEALATVEAYDPATDSWEAIPDMPTARFLAAVAAVGDKLYVIGGSRTDYTSLDVVEVFQVDQ